MTQVLVVDDLPANRRLLRAQLEAEGYIVCEAADGVEALGVLDHSAVSVVVSDILMPNMDGYRLCLEIRKDARWRDLPFIFYSSTYRSQSDEKLALEVGGDRFLAKPASVAEITAALRDVLSIQRPAPRAEWTVHGDLHLLKQYSARLVSKLEEQNTELYFRTGELEREVAERRRAEAALQEREQQLRQSAERLQALAGRLVEAQESERRRLSAELHDGIGQNLTALSINLNVLAGALPVTVVAGLGTRLGDSLALLQASIGSVRALMTELRPPLLEEYGILAALRWHAGQVQERGGLMISVSGIEPIPRLEPRVETALFRIAQEALHNTLKHAQAHQASVCLECDDGEIVLVLRDDGVGFDPAAVSPDARPHWGLMLMQERAEAVGARLQVTSAPGRGTQVAVTLKHPAATP